MSSRKQMAVIGLLRGPMQPIKTAAATTVRSSSAWDALENRQLFAVSLSAAGFTVFTSDIGDRTIYVSSSSGSDANSGLSPDSAVKTLLQAKSLVRSGTGDEMLLKRGDVWREPLGVWTKSGQSASDPILLGAYGVGDRPVVASGNVTALQVGSTAFPVVDHLAIVGIRFYADGRDPASPTFTGPAGAEGLRLLSGTTDLLVEDCEVDSYKTNISINSYFADASNIRLRRNVITDSYNVGNHSQGLYVEDIKGFTLEENNFDHNGWNTGVVGAEPTVWNHNAYIKESVDNFVARGNLFANAASHGLQARSGGIVENNTFLYDPIGLSFGLVNGTVVKAGGVSGRVTNNAFIGGGAIAGSPRGWGIELSNIKAGGGTVISGNTFTGAVGGSGFALYLTIGFNLSNANQAVGINDLTIENNVIRDWTKGLYINESLVPGGAGPNALNNVVIRNNDFQRMQTQMVLVLGINFDPSEVILSGNRYDSAAGTVNVSVNTSTIAWATWAPGRDTGSKIAFVTYVDPNRTAATYALSLNVGSATANYVNAARAMASDNWLPSLTGGALADYIRAGFGFGATSTVPGGTITPPPASPPTSTPVSPPASPPPPSSGTPRSRGEDDDEGEHAAEKAREREKEKREKEREKEREKSKDSRGRNRGRSRSRGHDD